MSAPATNGNNMTAQAVVDLMGTPPSFLSYTDGYKVFSLGEFGDNYTFYDVETQKYLRATSSTNNRMGLGDLDNNARASVTLNEDGTFDVVFQGENTRNSMRFNINASNNQINNDGFLLNNYPQNNNINITNNLNNIKENKENN